MPALSPDRRNLLRLSGLLATASALGIGQANAQPPKPRNVSAAVPMDMDGLRRGMISLMLPHEQFPVPHLVRLGALASKAGFNVLSTSDHIQPWQANEGHAGQAWVTMAAMGAQAPSSWMGTTVTCPTLRYNPAVVAEGFASLSLLYPGRIFLGVGSGEALNEQSVTGNWPKWQERWDRLIEAIDIIRALWTGQPVDHKGQFYTVNARLYDTPPKPIPLLTAANGRKSMRLAGIHGDGLISDPDSWKKWKNEWQDGAASAGKDPSKMPVLIEQFVTVGSQADARQAAELWRFLPKAWKPYFDIQSPVTIEQKADAQVPMEEVLKSWVISTDPSAHIEKIHELQESGVSIVNIHTGQPDQERVIDFYGSKVLPRLAQRHA